MARALGPRTLTCLALLFIFYAQTADPAAVTSPSGALVLSFDSVLLQNASATFRLELVAPPPSPSRWDVVFFFLPSAQSVSVNQTSTSAAVMTSFASVGIATVHVVATSPRVENLTANFHVASNSIASLNFSAPSLSYPAHNAVTPPPNVTTLSPSGALVATNFAPLLVRIQPSNASFFVPFVAGVAVLSSLIAPPPGNYTLLVSFANLFASLRFVASSGTPSLLSIVAFPLRALGGLPITPPPLLSVRDEALSPALNARGWSVAAVISNLTGGLSGQVIAPITAATATFDNLIVNKTGVYSLRFEIIPPPSASNSTLPPLPSPLLVVTPGPPHTLELLEMDFFPSPDETFDPPPSIRARDRGGNVVYASFRACVETFVAAPPTARILGDICATATDGGVVIFRSVSLNSEGLFKFTFYDESNPNVSVLTPPVVCFFVESPGVWYFAVIVGLIAISLTGAICLCLFKKVAKSGPPITMPPPPPSPPSPSAFADPARGTGHPPAIAFSAPR
jgi:hypothetical protein